MGGRVTGGGGKSGKLLRRGFEGRAYADKALGAAHGLLSIVIGGNPQAETFIRTIEQLSARPEIVLIVDVLAGGDVVNHAVAQSARDR